MEAARRNVDRKGTILEITAQKGYTNTMVKTLLKSVLIVLVLAGVFFFALQLWEAKKGKMIPPVEGQKTPIALAMVVTRVDVQPSADGVTLQISDVSPSGYSVRASGPGNGFLVEIGGAQLNLAKAPVPNPHPLITTVDVSQVQVGAGTVVHVRVDLAKECTYHDRMVGSVLFIDIVPTAPTPSPTVTFTPSPEPTKKPVKAIHKKPAKPVAKKPVAVKKPKVTAKPKKLVRLTPPPTPVPLEELAPAPTEPLLEPPPPSMNEPSAEPTVPPPPAAPAPAKKGQAPSGSLDLDKLFAESEPTPAPLAAEAPAVEVPSVEVPSPVPLKVAAVPPASSGVFESSKIQKNLFRVENLSIRNEGGMTTVEIEKGPKTTYKIFKMVDPYRIDVELQDVENGLKAEYPGVSGTKVRRVVTQEFRRPSGTLTRVMIYLSGQPQYERSVQGNSLILRLP